MAHWEERVTDFEYAEITKALVKVKPGISREKQHEAYDALTNNGMTPEEADEMINLVMEDV